MVFCSMLLLLLFPLALGEPRDSPLFAGPANIIATISQTIGMMYTNRIGSANSERSDRAHSRHSLLHPVYQIRSDRQSDSATQEHYRIVDDTLQRARHSERKGFLFTSLSSFLCSMDGDNDCLERASLRTAAAAATVADET
uniref:Putative secreted protein n=1 Tax=Anopheles marajoara TaxID=58244 RepID=A0A2M4C6L2_9DIPT